MSRHTVSHLSSEVEPSSYSVNRPQSQTRDNWGLSACQPTLSMQYPTIFSTKNTKQKTQRSTLVLSLIRSMSRRCSVGWRVHHGRMDCVRGTIDGAAMVMAADEDVTRRRKATHDQRRMQGARGQRGHLRQRCSCRSRRRHEGVEPGVEVSHVRPRSIVVNRRQLL